MRSLNNLHLADNKIRAPNPSQERPSHLTLAVLNIMPRLQNPRYSPPRTLRTLSESQLPPHLLVVSDRGTRAIGPRHRSNFKIIAIGQGSESAAVTHIERTLRVDLMRELDAV